MRTTEKPLRQYANASPHRLGNMRADFGVDAPAPRTRVADVVLNVVTRVFSKDAS